MTPTATTVPTRPLCPDFESLSRQFEEAGIPILGVSVTPSCRTLKALPSKPSIGFTPRIRVELAASQEGIPKEYLPKQRSEEDAFRCAVSAIAQDREFKDAGYYIRPFNSPNDEICFCVMHESDRDTATRDMQANSVQSVYYEKDSGKIKTQRQDIITPGGIVSPNLADYFHLFRNSITTEDLSTMVVNVVRDYCHGVPMRKGGGQYWIPRTQDGYPINRNLERLRAFCRTVQGMGQTAILFTEFPIADCGAIRKQLAAHVQADRNARLQDIQDEIEGMIAKIKESGEDKGRLATKQAKLKKLLELEEEAALMESLRVVKADRFRAATGFLKEQINALIGGRPQPTQSHLIEILGGAAADILGEKGVNLSVSDLGLDDLPDIEL